MSGHSKWHKIKHKKAITDKKKGQTFGRFSQDISIAAREGNDPSRNPALRDAIARAKKANVPQANIDRILSQHGADRQQIIYETFGPEGIGIIIITKTDNPKRTVAEIRNILKSHNSTMGTPGSVRWQFTSDFQPTSTVTPSPDGQEHLQSLIDELEEHPDVSQIYTTATP